MLILFAICTLIWGSTWLVILYQFGPVSPEVSVFYRFALTSLIMFTLARILKAPMAFNLRHHKRFALQGFSNFSMNYILTYHAEQYVTSGLVAVAFTLLIYFNMTGLTLFYKQRLEKKSLIGAAIGGLGILCIFAPELLDLSRQKNIYLGLFLGITATAFASVGNLASVRHKVHGITVLSASSWAMFYGALSTLLIVLLTGQEFTWDPRPQYLYSLLYLSVFGTVIAFLSYLTLVERLGADKAAYTAVATPIIAMIISSIMENYQWNFLNLSGIALCIIGNYFVLSSKPTGAAAIKP